MDVAGSDAGDPEALCELGEMAVAAVVAAGERPLKLHPQAIGTERSHEPPADRRRVGMPVAVDPPRDRAVPGAAR